MKFDNTKVRRQDRLLSEERAREIMAKAEWGVLSMIDLDGKPYGLPLNFVWEDACIYFHCAPQGKKLDALERNGEVSFGVVGDVKLQPAKFTTEYESVVIAGVATIVTSDEERMHALELLLRKLSPHDVEVGLKYASKSFYRTVIVRLDIDTFSAKCKRM